MLKVKFEETFADYKEVKRKLRNVVDKAKSTIGRREFARRRIVQRDENDKFYQIAREKQDAKIERLVKKYENYH